MNIQTLCGAAVLLIAAPAAAQQTTECRTDGLGVTRCETKPAPQGMNLNWDLLGLGRTPDSGEAFRKGMEQGRRASQEAWEHQQRQRAAQEQQAAAEQQAMNEIVLRGAAPPVAAAPAIAAAGVALSCTMHQLDGPLKQLGVTLFESQAKARVTHAGNTFMVDAAFTPDTVSWNVGEYVTTISRLDLSLVFGPAKSKETGSCALAQRQF